VLQQLASDAACAAGDVAGATRAPPPAVEALIASAAEALPESERANAVARVDAAVVAARLEECRIAAEQRQAAAALTAPHGDGLWTVGLEIAAGQWRSNGTGDSCYWQRSPDGNPDDIIDNHFGLAGGTVTLQDGEEFETSRCGTWEFVS